MHKHNVILHMQKHYQANLEALNGESGLLTGTLATTTPGLPKAMLNNLMHSLHCMCKVWMYSPKSSELISMHNMIVLSVAAATMLYYCQCLWNEGRALGYSHLCLSTHGHHFGHGCIWHIWFIERTLFCARCTANLGFACC